MSNLIPTRIVRRPPSRSLKIVDADVCVLGAGISGVSAALEAAKLGRKVVIVDGAPALGGQAIGSIIGTIIGLYTHGPNAYQITHGIADDLIRDLTAEGSLLRSHRSTVNFQYDEVRLARWMERKIEEAGVQALVGAVLTEVSFEDRRVNYIDFATRYGAVRVRAKGYIDSSGDATLCYEAALDVREPDAPIFGSMNDALPGQELHAREHQPLRDAARSARRREDGVRRTAAGGFDHPLPAHRVSAPLSRRSRAHLWQPRHSPDALDPEQAPAHAR
jgi:hypothetical protein